MCSHGKKVCKLHGGNSTGTAKGSKNALKHGAYSKIVQDLCFEDEIDIINNVSTDPIKIIEEQIKILRVKESRLAKLMKDALIAEREAGQDDGNGKKKSQTVLLNVSTIQSQNFQGETSKTVTSNSETHSLYYLRLEDAHTRLLAETRRALNNLARLKERKAEDQDVENYSGVLVTPGILSESEWEKAARVEGKGNENEKE